MMMVCQQKAFQTTKFEMFFRRWNCCRDTKTQSYARKTQTLGAAREDVMNSVRVVWREGNPTIHVQRNGAWTLPSSWCVTWMQRGKRGCPWENFNSAAGACFTNRNVNVFLSVGLHLKWSFRWSLALQKLMAKSPWTLAWSEFHPLGLTVVQTA